VVLSPGLYPRHASQMPDMVAGRYQQRYRLTAGLIFGVAEDSLDAAVPAHNVPRIVDGDDGVGGRSSYRPEAGLAALQRFLRLLAPGDVGVGAEHHQRFAVAGAGDDATAVVNPDPVAVLVFHATFAIVVGQFPREVPRQQLGGLVLVIGVDIHLPGLDADGGQLIQRIADDLRPHLVKDRFPSLDVPFPGADMGAFDDARHAL